MGEIMFNSNKKEDQKIVRGIDEDAIFKSLTHQVRRDIVKILGEKPLRFSNLQKKIKSVESPVLSYHLKNMQPLLVQKENSYTLSEIGFAALNLLSKTDQSVRISSYKRKFLFAYYITVICWIVAMTIIPFIIGSNFDRNAVIMIVQVVLTAISTINYIIVWNLRKRY